MATPALNTREDKKRPSPADIVAYAYEETTPGPR
jgi:hypothetical protein